jgi:hypothetical protein
MLKSEVEISKLTGLRNCGLLETFRIDSYLSYTYQLSGIARCVPRIFYLGREEYDLEAIHKLCLILKIML